MKKVILGIVGVTGHSTSHIRVCLRSKDAKLAAGCDISEANRKKAEDLYGIPMYPTVKEMLKYHKIDAVIIATPNFTHKDLTVECLKAGLKVLCEKPMANTLADCKKMAFAAAKHKGFLQIGFELRTCPVMRHIRKIIDSGVVGEIKHIHFLQTPGIKQTSWKLDQKRSGGLFIEKLCHQVDIFRYFLGEARSVTVFRGANTIPSYNIMDNCYATFDFGKGKVAHISFISGLAAVKPGMKEADYGRMGHGLRFDFLGSKGAVTYSYWDKSVSVTKHVKEKDGSYKSVLVSKKVFSNYRTDELYENLEYQDADFVRRVKLGLKENFNGADSLLTMKAAFAGEESARTGKTVTIR